MDIICKDGHYELVNGNIIIATADTYGEAIRNMLDYEKEQI